MGSTPIGGSKLFDLKEALHYLHYLQVIIPLFINVTIYLLYCIAVIACQENFSTRVHV